MLRTKQARKLLNKRQQKHMTEHAGINSMAKMKRQMDFMATQERDVRCFECWHIGKLLGL